MVPKAGLEPAQVSPPPPQDGVSTSSTTSAHMVMEDADNQDFRYKVTDFISLQTCQIVRIIKFEWSQNSFK